MSNDETANAIYIIILLVLVASSLIWRAGHDWGKTGKQAATWLAIFLVICLSAVYWEDFVNSKFASAIVPGKPQITEKGELVFIKGQDKHFHVTAQIDGHPIKFMLDTGASDIVLSRADAQKLGYDLSTLKFDKFYSTANGTTRGASINLEEFVVGNISLKNLPASVNKGEMNTSLLGMEFLNRMKSYKVEGEKLIIKP